MEIISPLKTPNKISEKVVEPVTPIDKNSSVKSIEMKMNASLNETADIEQKYFTQTVTQVKTSWFRSKAFKYVIYVTIAVFIAAALVAVGAGGEYLFGTRQRLKKEKQINNVLDYTNFLVLQDKPEDYEVS